MPLRELVVGRAVDDGEVALQHACAQHTVQVLQSCKFSQVAAQQVPAELQFQADKESCPYLRKPGAHLVVVHDGEAEVGQQASRHFSLAIQPPLAARQLLHQVSPVHKEGLSKAASAAKMGSQALCTAAPESRQHTRL